MRSVSKLSVALPALLVGVVDVVAAHGNTTTTSVSASPTEACAVVSAAWASQHAAAPTVTPTVSAQLAYDCLNSVPLGKQAALDLVDSIFPYLEWQSDAAYKADPPADYDFPAYDMFGALEKIRSNLEADVYASEYAFQAALYNEVFGPGHDGHFVYYPDLLTAVFEWTRQRALVSISEDGSSLPVIKVYEEVVSSPETASVVKLINGVDAAQFLDETTNKANWNRDADSAYNSVFFEQSLFATTGGEGYFKSGGRIRYVYQGANTTLTFANGTEGTFENRATIKKALTGVVDGPSFYTKFCDPANPAADAPASTTAPNSTTTTWSNSTTAAPLLPGYPSPVITTKDGVVSGYYLEGEGLADVAVIVLTAFESQDPAEFQAVARDFYAAALAAGKTKLVVDFQQNGGGYILQGYDFFRQLFPTKVQDGFSRWKENDGFLAAAEIVSDVVGGVDVYASGDETLVGLAESWFNWRYDYNLTNAPFTSFDDKFAPRRFQNTSYTNLMRWNLDDPLTTSNATFGLGIDVTGYGNLSGVAAQPFEADNIVILYDGVCASTCTLASEFLRLRGGVRSVALGGRPRAGAIEGVGGVKGSQVLDWSSIHGFASELLPRAATDGQKAALARYGDLPLNRSLAAAVNVRDQILRPNLDDGVPAQFVREPADCRLYWTLPMVRDVAEVWRAAANSAFNGAECAYGGIERTDVSAAAEVRRRDYLAASLLQKRAALGRRGAPETGERYWQDKYVLKAID
ncbi:Peptidase S41 family protein ustP [Colletotrichum spinosum]|uniref:Peptidase S41 family protein ustP n=1 Tax=Colletotrichum spinosum TaxID=1347390 RepID=A0A4R8Q539_9PEZI|nr:Peptidase S41 family protein ustP [Colletotrichum spinosum]